VKSVLTSHAIYHITLLSVPLGIMEAIQKLERAFFWTEIEKVWGRQRKVIWKLVCRPFERVGLGVLDLNKFARALRLCWSLFQWKDPSKVWIGTENPCDNADMEFFYAATTISVEDGRIANFWHAPWLQGLKSN
jgi:hypothetical protein